MSKLDQKALQRLVIQAYTEYGHDVIRWGDGSIGIQGASERQTLVTSRIQELVLIALGELEPSTTVIHLKRAQKLLCGASVDDKSYLQELPWSVGRATCKACLAKSKHRSGRVL